MSTETLSPPFTARPHDDGIAVPVEETQPSTRRPERSPRLTRRGAGHLLRSLVSGADGRPSADHVMVLGPSGGPIWTSRLL